MGFTRSLDFCEVCSDNWDFERLDDSTIVCWFLNLLDFWEVIGVGGFLSLTGVVLASLISAEDEFSCLLSGVTLSSENESLSRPGV